MKRPLKDVRPIGPFSVKKTHLGLTKEEGDEEFLLIFDLQGDVTQYSNDRRKFSSFVKSALGEYNVFFSSYKGYRANESPYEGDSYKAFGTMSSKSEFQVNKVISTINDKVEDSLPSEFMVEDITIKMEE